MARSCTLYAHSLGVLIITSLFLTPVFTSSDSQDGSGSSLFGNARYNTDSMFPYDWRAGADPSNQPIEVQMDFLFMGTQYNTVYISADGHITFGEAPQQYRAEKLPFLYPDVGDPPMAAVFFADISKNRKVDDVGEFISKVIHQPLWDTRPADQDMLNELGRQIRLNAVSDVATFSPTHALLVTWHSVRYGSCYLSGQTCSRNTFQTAIVTDGNLTYAIYNYKELNWLGSINQRCNPDTGKEDNGFERCFPAQVGFNLGSGRLFIPLPGSNTNQVLDLPQNQGSRTVGRYIYKVSHEKAHRDGCTSASGMQPLAVYPEVAGMLGGEELYAAGPCLLDVNTKMTCLFSLFETSELRQVVDARVLDDGRVVCPVPALSPVSNKVYLMVKMASRAEYLHQTFIQIEAPRRSHMRVKLDDYRNTWLQRDPDNLTLSWEPEMLNKGWLDHLDANGTYVPPEHGVASEKMVDILLFGYRENTDGNGQVQRTWVLIKVLSTGQENNGLFEFSPSDYRCSAGIDCDWHLGAIKVQPTGIENHQTARGLYSDMIPLGWYIEDIMTTKHGQNWPEVLCREWKDQESPAGEEPWQSELLPCPCTAAQAYSDEARFIVDPDCDTNSTEPVPCPLSPEAEHCYVSLVPTKQGAETKCCYNRDGRLLYSADSNGGSYSGRAHEAGITPYTAQNSMPRMSHWLVDKLPYLWCCMWSTNPGLCLERYEPHRRTPSCSNYKSPAMGFAFGDPHFVTFDGTNYTFNGYAEYWLVQMYNQTESDNFRLQARMSNNNGQISGISATVITAVAMQLGGSPKFSFFLNPPLALDRVAVYVNDEYQNFYTQTQLTFSWPSGTVRITRNGDSSLLRNFTATTHTGISVTVAEKAGVLQVMTSLPPASFENTGGLFGFWDGDSQNDLRTRDGAVVVDPTNNAEVHDIFGADWKVKDGESVFHYFGSTIPSDFVNDSFVPTYEPQLPQRANGYTTMNDVNQKCGSNEFCRFDYITTGSEAIAVATLETETWAHQAKSMSAEVPVCPYLYVERSFRQNDANYLAGGKVQLTGCIPGYTLIGPSTYDCVLDGEVAKWAPHPSSTVCKADTQIAAEKQQQAVAIAVPITLIVVAAIVAVIVFVVFKTRKQQKDPKRPPHELPRQEVPVNPKPNPDKFGTDTNLSQSRTSLNSRTSNSSIVLTQELVSQRPPRPTKTKQPTGEDDRHYDDVPRQGYDNPDYAQPTGPMQYRGAGDRRPVSVLSHDPAASSARSRDEETRSLDGEAAYAQPIRRPYGYDNMAAVGDDAKVAPVKGPWYQGYQPAPKPTPPPAEPQYPYKPQAPSDTTV